MKNILHLFCMFVGSAVAISAQAAVIYVTDVDSQTAYIVDTDAGTFTSHDTAPVDSPGAIAVTGRIVIADWQGDGAAEFDLAYNATGPTYAGFPEYSQMLDGTTDGVGTNYAVSWNNAGVIVFDANFENASVLFAPSGDPIGITYDQSDDTLWLVNDDTGDIENYTLGGSFVDSFSPGLDGRECCLAYDPADDTLWLSTNGSNTFYQYSKAGSELDSVTIAGWEPSNTWGAEIQLGEGGPIGAEPVPGPGAIALGLLAALVLLVAGFAHRRTV